MLDDHAHKKANGMLRNYLFIWTIKRLHLHTLIRHAEIGALEEIIQDIQYKKN